MLADSDVDLLLTKNLLASKLPESNIKMVEVDDDNSFSSDYKKTNPKIKTDSEHVATNRLQTDYCESNIRICFHNLIEIKLAILSFSEIPS